MHGGSQARSRRPFASSSSHLGSPEANRRFISLCSSHDALVEAGRLYRQVKEATPRAGTRPRADSTQFCLRQSSSSRSPEPRPPDDATERCG